MQLDKVQFWPPHGCVALLMPKTGFPRRARVASPQVAGAEMDRKVPDSAEGGLVSLTD